jgi:lipopolysaccharide export system permease protein
METFGIKRTNEDQFKYHEYMKNTSELSAQIDTVRRDIRSKTKDQTRQLKSQNAYLFRTNYGKVDSTKKAVPIMVGKWIQDKMKVSETSYREMEILETSISQLKNFISTLETDRTIILNRNKEVWRADIERWHKITMAFSCMVMFLIGSSLGSIIKKGGFGMPVLVSISFFILLYVLMQLGDKYAKEGIIPVLVGVWIPNTVLLLIGIYLMSKASNDSRLFENDTLVKFQNTLSNLMSVFTKIKAKTDTV